MSSQTLKLRGYEPEDLDSLFSLDKLCFAKPFRFSRSAMRQFAQSPNARVLVCEIDSSVAGFCILHIETVGTERVAYVTTLDVDPCFRRQGIAGRLMAEAENVAISAECNALALHVFIANLSAVQFYEHEGFERLGTAKDFYGAGLSAFEYRKETPR